MKNYEATNCPEIYINTYWGAYLFEPNSQDVIKARNDFGQLVKKYTGRYLKTNKLFLEDRMHFDHCEIYEDILGGVIIIVSPYKNNITHGYLEMMGFVKIPSMYSNATESYAKSTTRKGLIDFNKRLQQWD
jgi:hypothetical protein